MNCPALFYVQILKEHNNRKVTKAKGERE